jgi:endonuclease/exonuclease/phosphatase (EEP) superfamily protein YafD
VVLPQAIWRRQRGVVALAALTLLLNAALIGRLAWQPGADRDRLVADFSLKVLSFNVLSSNPGKSAILDYVQAADADVVFLMEVDAAWAEALAALRTRYPHHLMVPRPDNFGLALFSRSAFSGTRILELGEGDLPTVEARVMHQGRSLMLVGTHPMPPVGRRNASLRDSQLRDLAAHVSRSRDPVLLVGDLNATPWSQGMRLLTGGAPLRSSVAQWQPTWRAGSPIAVPIDHALATAPLVITQVDIGPDLGSDHRPVQVKVGWAQ